MSAWVVNREHIVAMLRAGLSTRDRLQWLAPEDEATRLSTVATDYERGAMTGGPTAHETYQRRRRELNEDTCNETGRMLLMANVRSVAWRYNEPIDAPDLPGPCDLNVLAETYPAGDVVFGVQYPPVVILKALDCYEYQSCEHPSWPQSEAKAFCAALRDQQIGRLPGYDAAPWGL